MQSVSYYAYHQNSNVAGKNSFLQVNCAGHAIYSHRPVADTVRKDYYFIYMIKGELSVSLPVQSRILHDGDVILLEADKPFAYKGVSEGVDYYWVHFTGADAESITRRLGIPMNQVTELGMSRTVCDRFATLFLSFMTAERIRELTLASALLSLLIAVGERLDGEKKRDSAASALVSRSSAYIHENIQKELSVESLAAREFLSPGRYREVFRSVLGISPQEYILRLRVNIACDLLRHTATPIAAVSLQVGYPDARYFSRVFHQRMGMTPSEYRKKK